MHVREHGLPCVLVSDWCLAQVVLRSEGSFRGPPLSLSDSFNLHISLVVFWWALFCVLVVLCWRGILVEVEAVEVEGMSWPTGLC